MEQLLYCIVIRHRICRNYFQCKCLPNWEKLIIPSLNIKIKFFYGEETLIRGDKVERPDQLTYYFFKSCFTKEINQINKIAPASFALLLLQKI